MGILTPPPPLHLDLYCFYEENALFIAFKALRTRNLEQKLGKWLYLGSWAPNQKSKGTLFSPTFKVTESKVSLLFLFMAQEPRYGYFHSFINNIQKAEIEIQKIEIAKKPELIWPNHYSFGYIWPLNWQNQLKYPMHQPTFFIL